MKRTIFAALAFAGAWFAGTGAAVAADRDAADALRNASRYAEAVPAYEEVLKEFPDDGPSLYGIGICLTMIGVYSEKGTDSLTKSRPYLEKAAGKFPQFAEYRGFNGYSAFELARRLAGQPEKRKECFDLAEREVLGALEAETSEDKKPTYRQTLGLIYKETGRLDEARKTFQELAARIPQFPWYPFWIAEIEQAAGNEPAAVEAYLKALSLDPKGFRNAVAALSQISSRLRAEGKFKESAALGERIAACKPDPFYLGWALKELADNRVDLGDDRGAIAALLEAEAAQPSEANFPNRMGLIHLSMGDREKAVACFRRAIEKNPLLLYPYENMGTELAALGKIEETRELYKKGLKAAEQVASTSPRADVRAEADFYRFLFRWNLDELEAYRK
ncbi:MAG: tetratricopeptide repeat protein [Planctomycetes bacterium]|nr:tetratricopeptide repeat protein [Planctomycetota bacterium]